MSKEYTRFEIEGKEYELRFCVKAMKLIDKDGGSFALVQKALQGGFEDFVNVIYYALIHTKEGITRERIEEALDKQLESEKFDLDDIIQYNKAVVLNSFFFKKVVSKMLAEMTDEQRQAFEKIYG